jgi:hypothetical protein
MLPSELGYLALAHCRLDCKNDGWSYLPVEFNSFFNEPFVITGEEPNVTGERQFGAAQSLCWVDR